MTPLFAHHLLAAHRRLVPIVHSHSCSPHHSSPRDVAGFSRFVRGVKWRHQTLSAAAAPLAAAVGCPGDGGLAGGCTGGGGSRDAVGSRPGARIMRWLCMYWSRKPFAACSSWNASTPLSPPRRLCRGGQEPLRQSLPVRLNSTWRFLRPWRNANAHERGVSY